MFQIDEQMSLAQIVLQHPATANVLQRHHIEYCCKGALTLSAAAVERGLTSAQLLAELRDATAAWGDTPPGIDLREVPTPMLVQHVVSRHHRVVREALPQVMALARKVARVHGAHNLKLLSLRDEVGTLSDTLLPHLEEEEQVLFPALVAAASPLGEALAAADAEHLEVGHCLARIRELADGFIAPEWACSSYRTLFAELQRLEQEIVAHIHLERHVLRPRFDGKVG